MYRGGLRNQHCLDNPENPAWEAESLARALYRYFQSRFNLIPTHIALQEGRSDQKRTRIREGKEGEGEKEATARGIFELLARLPIPQS